MVLNTFTSVSRIVDNTLSSAILKSLWYESMPMRYSSITDAQAKTFDWIFQDHLSDTDPRSKVDFLSSCKAVQASTG